MQQSRRTNPYPFTWEIPAGLAVAFLLAQVLGLQVGRSVANLLAGNGWVFVGRADLFSTIGGLLGGHAGAGLTGVAHPAATGLMWTCIAVVELAVLASSAVAIKVGMDRWGPGRIRGMATQAQAEAVLGRARLRKHASIIRPDLYRSGRGGDR
ncbi:MAG: hypothetical protein KQH57_11610 [Actinomycetales bacterium]|nr:hypothetical protein [Actinomycetales bacterium]